MSNEARFDAKYFSIRTSARRTFRRCLRKWGYQSALRENLVSKGSEQNIHFWFGSAIHYAMEDYFGYNRFGDPRKAFNAYVQCFKERDLPEGAHDYYQLGISMLTYFLEWLPKHNEAFDFQTLWLTENNMPVEPFTPGARPAVEEEFTLDLGLRVLVDVKKGKVIKPYVSCPAQDANLDAIQLFDGTIKYFLTEDGKTIEVDIVPVCYHGTVDRICVDKFGRWWILDYKTAKGADTNKLDTDDQISAYMWAMEQYLGHPIHGFIYLQLTKDFVRNPKRLSHGAISVDKKQKTTHALYRKALIEEYGEVKNAPNKYIETLNHFAALETPEGDRFIRWDLVTRTPAQKVSTYNHIMAEAHMMIQPDLYLFPNPTRDCIWDCNFREICLKTDADEREEVERLINLYFEPRGETPETNHDSWREFIKYPTAEEKELPFIPLEKLEEDLDFCLVLPDDITKEEKE